MTPHQNHYELLGIPRNADAETIRRAYRQKMKAAHPDQFAARLAEAQASGDETRIRAARREFEGAEEASKQINLAYAILSDPVKRRRYDLSAWQHEVNARRATYTPPRPPPRSSTPPHYRRPPRQQTRQTPRYQARQVPPVAANKLSGFAIGSIIFAIITVLRLAAMGISDAQEARREPVRATVRPVAMINLTDVAAEDGDSLADLITDRAADGRIIIDAAPSGDDADTLYESGLDMLAQSEGAGDMAEYRALTRFVQAILKAPDHRMAHRMLGEIYYGRWQAAANELDRLTAQYYLTRYDVLTSAPLDDEMRAMLAAVDQR